MSQALAIADSLRTSRSVLILNHVNPDGDSLGSTLALALALDRLGVAAEVGSHDGVPPAYAFLPGADRITTAVGSRPSDAAVFMECSEPSRAGSLASAGLAARVVINVDHHLSNTGYGTLVWWETSAAAVGEMILEVIHALGVEVDAPIATCLYAALMTDTGSFRYSNTTTRSFAIAADLVARGADPYAIAQMVYERRSLAAVRLHALALAGLRVEERGQFAWAVVTEQMARDAGGSIEQAAGLAGQIRAIEGVRLAALFEEWPEGIRVSLRSRDGVASNEIAERFGGGGHAAAAGFVSPGPLGAVVEQTRSAAREALRASAEWKGS